MCHHSNEKGSRGLHEVVVPARMAHSTGKMNNWLKMWEDFVPEEKIKPLLF